MSKIITISKREYLQAVRSKTFIIATILGPVLALAFVVVPGFIFNMKVGKAMRIAIVDQTGKLYNPMRESILRKEQVENISASPAINNQLRKIKAQEYNVEEVAIGNGQTLEAIKQHLNERIHKGELDTYIIIPPDILDNGQAELYSRNVGDIDAIRTLKDRLSRPVVSHRMQLANLDYDRVRKLNESIKLNTFKVSEKGEEKDSGAGVILAFAVSLFIYIATLMYGQVVLAAVVEEKTTRIAEVLFSAARAFDLMVGKLVGVTLVALTQYFIWVAAFGLVALYGISSLLASGIDLNLSGFNPALIVYSLIFFLLGLFLYTSVYAVIGSMVTSEKEGSQMIMPLTFVFMFGFYLVMPVIRSPDSSFAFWVSLIPFFSPMLMMSRIVTLTPPLWEIALSILIMLGTIILMVWLASRIYRIGMLMYGKRATIPEVLRWMRQT